MLWEAGGKTVEGGSWEEEGSCRKRVDPIVLGRAAVS